METRASQPNNPPYRGADESPARRPGSPREAEPHPLPGAHWATPPQQPIEGPEIVTGLRDRKTPVFSTALPPRGLSGAVRRVAHLLPDHRVTHWMLLFLADRIDVVETLLRPARRA